MEWQTQDPQDAAMIGVPEPPCPQEYGLYMELHSWGDALPIAGAYFEQPYTLMRTLQIVRMAIQRWQRPVAKTEIQNFVAEQQRKRNGLQSR